MGVSTVIDAEPIWFSEIDPGASAVLAYRFPGIPNIGDLRAAPWEAIKAPDILCAGFPCQPVSGAGQRKGVDDDRWLWPDIEAAIGRMDPQPRLLVLENVLGLLSAGNGNAFSSVIHGLAALGYVGSYGIFPASGAGCPHRRERWFCVAAHTAQLGRGWHPRTVGETAAGGDGRRPLPQWPAPVDRGGAAAHTERHGLDGPQEPGADRRTGQIDTRTERRTAEKPAGNSRLRTSANTAEPGFQGSTGGGVTEEGRSSGGPDVSAPADTPAPRLQGVESARRQDQAVRQGKEARRPGSDRSPVPAADTELNRPQGSFRRIQGPAGSEGSDGLAAGDLAAANPGGDRLERIRGNPERSPEVRSATDGSRHGPSGGSELSWGKYEHAIRRWERVLGRPAPVPVVPAKTKTGNRLNPAFSEWMMGLPEGWVTEVPDLSRREQLSCIGNGCVPQQVAMAVRSLLPALEDCVLV